MAKKNKHKNNEKSTIERKVITKDVCILGAD